MKKIFFALLILISIKSNAQVELINHLKQHIYTLASDSLDGRCTGTEGEKKAQRYLISQLKEIGVAPKGVDGFLQPFEFNSGIVYTGVCSLELDRGSFKPDVDFFPLSSSGSGTVSASDAKYIGYGIEATDLNYNDYEKISSQTVFIISLGSPDGENPHSKYYPYTDISSKIETAIKHGATGIIFINTDTASVETLKKDFTKNSSRKNIPVVFMKPEASFSTNWNTKKKYVVNLTVNVETVRRKGSNIISYLDNNAPYTVVFGAHYDHLGHGYDDNALDVGNHDVHNGADDNASGSAAVIELARLLKNSNLKKYNYCFVNFSGEELGLIGSKYFVEHSTIDTSKINYMINMDMIGRYDTSKAMEISGLGTSTAAFNFIRTLNYDHLKIKPTNGGTGPSDHSSFYYANIPVINFFTGSHSDYHKVSDDADKINYEAEASIVNMIILIIDSVEEKGILPFEKTTEQSSDVPAFKVRLGVIPDYMYEGIGLRIDGVTEGQPANKAGLLKGDIVLQVGDYPVADIMAYMKALSMFQKGDTTIIKYKRGEEEKTTELKF